MSRHGPGLPALPALSSLPAVASLPVLSSLPARLPVALTPVGKRAGVVGAVVGVLSAGAAVGLAAPRFAVRRPPRRRVSGSGWRGAPRGEVHRVTADDGVVLHAEVYEPPEPQAGAGRPTVVLCHGLALTRDTFAYQRPELRDVGRLVLWDQRGHGRSGRGDRDHATIDQLGRDLHRVLEELVPHGPVVLVGHSMGGMTVMALADQHPELFGDRVIGVALISTSPGALAQVTLGVPAFLARAVHRLAPRGLAVMGRQSRLVERGRRAGGDSTLGFLLTKRYSFASDVPPPLVEFVAQMIASTPLDVLAELFPAFDAHDKLAALDVLDGVETLILVGDGDLVTPPEHSEQMALRLPGAELVVVPRAGHLVLLEHPDVVNGHLRGLVERALRASAAA